MSNLYFIISGLFISILLNIIFFTKKKQKRMDNFLYGNLLIINLIDCILMTLIVLIGYNKFGNEATAKLLNLILFNIFYGLGISFYMFIMPYMKMLKV